MTNTQTVSLETFLRDISDIPSLPILYIRLDETINHPRSSIADISAIISEDQGLTAKILKLANSPLFGHFGKIDTISRAVTILGVQQLRDLSLAVSVMGMFKNVTDYPLVMEQFWRHSIACGLAARALATSQRESNLERYFVAGILHDIGRLAFVLRIPDQYKALIEQSRRDNRLLLTIEQEQLGFDHAMLAGALLREWKLPLRVSEPVEYHHRFARAAHHPKDAALLHLADIIAHALQLGESGEIAVPPLDAEAWNQLEISTALLEPVIKQIEPQYVALTQILNDGAANV